MSDKIILQVNSTGAWKNVTTFDASRRDDVVRAVAALEIALGCTATWCLLHADGHREWLK